AAPFESTRRGACPSSVGRCSMCEGRQRIRAWNSRNGSHREEARVEYRRNHGRRGSTYRPGGTLTQYRDAADPYADLRELRTGLLADPTWRRTPEVQLPCRSLSSRRRTRL